MNHQATEFRAWLKRHQNHLRGYSSNEIALLALACGFTLEVVCPDLVDWIPQVKRVLELWESPFLDQWQSLRRCQAGHEWESKEATPCR